MNDIKEIDIKYTWELVSQFVCWEFCRNANSKGVICGVKQTDLFQFFKDMVIKMTTKKYESDITSQEIAAKFIEELSMLLMSSKPQQEIENVTQRAETLKKLCPQLKPAITDLLSTIYPKLFAMRENKSSNFANDVQLWKSVKAFSVEVNKHLPVPDLIKVTHSWKSKAQTANKPLKDLILARLKKEKITKHEAPKIQKSIDNDILLRMYYEEVSYVPPGYENKDESEVEHEPDAHEIPDNTEIDKRGRTDQSPVSISTNISIIREEPSSNEISEIEETPVKSSRRTIRRVSEDTEEERNSGEEIVIVKEVSCKDVDSICKRAVVRLKRVKIEDTSDEDTLDKDFDINSKKSYPRKPTVKPASVAKIKKEYDDIFLPGKKSRIRSSNKKKKK